MFSTLDANSGDFQGVAEKIDGDKTAFTSHHKLYRFDQLPFGLTIAPKTIQRAMDSILSIVIW